MGPIYRTNLAFSLCALVKWVHNWHVIDTCCHFQMLVRRPPGGASQTPISKRRRNRTNHAWSTVELSKVVDGCEPRTLSRTVDNTRQTARIIDARQLQAIALILMLPLALFWWHGHRAGLTLIIAALIYSISVTRVRDSWRGAFECVWSVANWKIKIND